MIFAPAFPIKTSGGASPRGVHVLANLAGSGGAGSWRASLTPISYGTFINTKKHTRGLVEKWSPWGTPVSTLNGSPSKAYKTSQRRHSSVDTTTHRTTAVPSTRKWPIILKLPRSKSICVIDTVTLAQVCSYWKLDEGEEETHSVILQSSIWMRRSTSTASHGTAISGLSLIGLGQFRCRKTALHTRR